MGKSIIRQDPGCCYLCGKPLRYREEHHIFGGPNRKWSEKYGLKVYLCYGCHQGSRTAVHNDAGTMQKLHEDGQRAFEKIYSREKFREIFGKSYLEDQEIGQTPVNTGAPGLIWIEEGKG